MSSIPKYANHKENPRPQKNRAMKSNVSDLPSSTDFYTAMTQSVSTGNGSKSIGPEEMFELVSGNYDNWQQVISKRFEEVEDDDDDNFSPFPREEMSLGKPFRINEMSEALKESHAKKMTSSEMKKDGANRSSASIRATSKSTPKGPRPSVLSHALLNTAEIDFLRNKITQMIQGSGSGSTSSPDDSRFYDARNDNDGGGGGGYGSNEEMDACSCCGSDHNYFDQDDYDLSEVNGEEDYAYKIPSTRHIEVELNTAPPCPKHPKVDCDCPIFNTSKIVGDGRDGEGPSCEFTFEYDRWGKLISTSDNIEEKLRRMQLEARKPVASRHSSNKRSGDSLRLRSARGAAKDSKIRDSSATKAAPVIDPLQDLKSFRTADLSKQLHAQTRNQPNTAPRNFFGLIPSDYCCLLCQYEAVFGCKPIQLLKLVDKGSRNSRK
ncbi:uncharacterized protein LODBEIA_P02390 [Lodderomyces beijingensis]|uniref:Uncharacterized protein n=1 Tax=Lodderomyces beijingensis TaxID=1775926 RepID=A0ABP0ZI49_9ASCO